MRIFSGIQPTGAMHIGNYLGAVRNWVELQKHNECLFCVVDLHAITVPQDPGMFSKTTMEKVIELLALGIDPSVSALFVQSHVKEHTELAWILNTVTPMGELERMTQYKDKSKKYKASVNAGLLNYPILMASDILLYQTEAVPVGEDQNQHLEFTRMVAKKFNGRYGATFKEPKAVLPDLGARIMSLEDLKKKMSKSDSAESQIKIFEEPPLIRKKISGAVTDAGKEIRYDPVKKPGISNLLAIYSLFGEIAMQDAEKKFKTSGYAGFKKALADLLVEKLEPFRKKKKELENREVYIKEILKKGSAKAASLARFTMENVRKRVGFLELS
ncbi:MAG: tryptophan--tRNA ligase [Candidatus Wildermuthbacteria bacterium]|nr:tryptophan--tRNA ligase [Candidatus Wildermuthbacteria bacterium]